MIKEAKQPNNNNKVVSKVGDRSRGRPEVSLFNSEYTEVSGRALLLSLDFSTLPLIHTLYCWVLSKEVSSTIFKVFGMTRPGIEPRSTGPLANTLPTNPMSRLNNNNKTQQNSKCRLCGNRDEMINHIINECRKLAQKEYKTRNKWVGKVIHWDMCKKFKFRHTNKWYLHNPSSVLENETHKLLWEFDIQMDHLISARWPDLKIINNKKENLQNCGLCCPRWPPSKIERKRKEG